MKKGFTLVEVIAIIVVLSLIALVVFPSFNNIVKKNEENKRETELRNIYMAAENYANENELLKRLNSSDDYIMIKIKDLKDNQFLDNNVLNPYNNNPFGENDLIKINKNLDSIYNYEIVYGKKTSLIELLLEQYKPENTVGLLKESETKYYYKGDVNQVSNNFLWIGGHQWRVLEFDIAERSLKLITQQPLTSISPVKMMYFDDIDYEQTYINNWLNNYFYNSLNLENKKETLQNKIIKDNYNIIIPSEEDPIQTGNNVTVLKNVGLLDSLQYKKAGGQNSYLDINDDFLLQNRKSYDDGSPTASSIFEVTNEGIAIGARPTFALGIRPVIKISDVDIYEGSGTLKDNFKVINGASKTSEVNIGDYVSVPYSGSECKNGNCLFRVINKDNNSVKITLNGLLSKTVIFGNVLTSNMDLKSHPVFVELNKFKQGISEDYRLEIPKEFGIGKYGIESDYTGPDYEDSLLSVLKTDIGLPVSGEIFSGNDIDLKYSGNAFRFVDSGLLENCGAINEYWTMNYSKIDRVRAVHGDGLLWYNNPKSQDNSFGIRPVIFLKNNLRIFGGDGSPSNPFRLK